MSSKLIKSNTIVDNIQFLYNLVLFPISLVVIPETTNILTIIYDPGLTWNSPRYAVNTVG